MLRTPDQKDEEPDVMTLEEVPEEGDGSSSRKTRKHQKLKGTRNGTQKLSFRARRVARYP